MIIQYCECNSVSLKIIRSGNDWQMRDLFVALREVVISSVLDEDPPCVGVGRLCKIPPV